MNAEGSEGGSAKRKKKASAGPTRFWFWEWACLGERISSTLEWGEERAKLRGSWGT